MTLAGEVGFWYVSASQADASAQLLETQAFISISPERAAPLIGLVPGVPPGESLYLMRAIELTDSAPLLVFQLGTWVEVYAWTYSTCFLSGPSISRRPIVVALPRAPARLRLSYACDGQAPHSA